MAILDPKLELFVVIRHLKACRSWSSGAAAQLEDDEQGSTLARLVAAALADCDARLATILGHQRSANR